MHLGIALGLLQAAAATAGSAPAALDLKCTSVGNNPPVAFAFHIDLPKETFSVVRASGPARSGTAESFGPRIVLELPSTNPDAIPMFFINTDAMTYKEVTRAGASAMTPVTDGKCDKTMASAS